MALSQVGKALKERIEAPKYDPVAHSTEQGRLEYAFAMGRASLAADIDWIIKDKLERQK